MGRSVVSPKDSAMAPGLQLSMGYALKQRRDSTRAVEFVQIYLRGDIGLGCGQIASLLERARKVRQVI